MTGKLNYSRALGSRKAGYLIFILGATFLLAGSYLFAAEKSGDSGPVRYKFFHLKQISAEQGMKYLSEAKIGTVSRHPKPGTLLVTAQQGELTKAEAILAIVDAEEKHIIRTLFPASAAGDLPSNEQIAAEVGNVSIGTFSKPPPDTAKVRAIIDIHNGGVVVVAPADQLERIIAAIERATILRGPLQEDVKIGTRPLQKTKSGLLGVAEPNMPVEPNQIIELETGGIVGVELEKIVASPEPAGGTDTGDYEPDELFGKLLDSLAEAEIRVAESQQVVPEPNEPNTIAAVPEANVPSEPSTGVNGIEETALLALEQPEEANLPVVEGLEAKPVTAEPKLELKLEPTIEGVAVETEQPSEGVAILKKEGEKGTEVVEPAVPVGRSYLPEPSPLADETLDLDLPEKLELIVLLDLVGKYLQLDYMYDEKDLKNQWVNLRIQGPIKVKELYPMVESVLKFKGFVMARKDNFVTIVPKTKALQIDPTLLKDEEGKIQRGDVIATRVFKLKHIDASSAKNLLKGMQLGENVTPIDATRTLIVTGYTYRMARIEELLRMVDQPGKPRKFRYRPLIFTMAEKLAPKIKTLAEQLGTVSVTIAAPPAAPVKKPPRRGRPPVKKATVTPPKAPEAGVYLEADERTNRILMIGVEEQLAIVDDLITALDVEQQDLRSLRLFDIRNVGAEEVVDKLTELGIIGAGKARPTAPARPTKGKIKSSIKPTAAKEALTEEPQVVIIEATNSLLVNATPQQHAQIELIIGYVDCEARRDDIPYVVYHLENQDPEKLAGVLNELIRETITTKATKGTKTPKTTTTKRIEEDIIIIPDPKTYSLIVYASKKNQLWIRSLIDELDEYRPQVLLDVTLVEITKNEKFDLDLNASLLSALPNLSLISTTGAIENSAVTAFYKDKDVDILLEALQEKGYGRILARPTLLVNDHEEGTIKTEEQTSVAQVRTVVLPAPAGGFPTSSQDVTFQSYIAGITLTITPHISKGDQLGLTITLTRTDFRLKKPTSIGKVGQEDVYPTPPDLLTSDVTTNVTVPDGTTIILGGLEKINQTKGGTKVPLLGDIPIVGGLFRTTSNQDDQSRLYVFVKANILRPGEELTGASDIEVVSAKNRATFEKYEKEMQEYEDWPGIKPEPMDPVRILEAD